MTAGAFFGILALEVISVRDIGKNIRDLREHSGLTQEALAEKLFVTRQTVSNYETGKTRPDLDMLLRIAETLNCDANAVLYGLPVSPKRQRALRQLAITAGIFLILLLLDLVAQPLAKRYMSSTYLAGPYMVVNVLLDPLCWMLGGFFLTNLCKLAPELRVTLPQWLKWVCIVLLSLWGFGFLLLLVNCGFHIYGDILVLTRDSVSISLSLGKILDVPAYWFMRLTLYAAPLWLIPGFLLALILPKKEA